MQTKNVFLGVKKSTTLCWITKLQSSVQYDLFILWQLLQNKNKFFPFKKKDYLNQIIWCWFLSRWSYCFVPVVYLFTTCVISLFTTKLNKFFGWDERLGCSYSLLLQRRHLFHATCPEKTDIYADELKFMHNDGCSTLHKQIE